jgi:hypothetical protein
MSLRKTLTAVILLGLAAAGCDYIVPPIDTSTATPTGGHGWEGIVTHVGDVNGALHVDISIANHTSDWSAMDVAASKAQVADASGKKTTCGTVFVGTSVFVNNGGWYIPTGFVMKGYTGGSVDKPQTQLLYVECAGVTAAPGQVLTVNYTFITGPFNYYVASHKFGGTMTLSLDKVVTSTTYPIVEKTSPLVINKADALITGINNCTVQITAVKRTDAGFEFDWDSKNPTAFPAYIHIGNPPLLGTDGILYGFYESPILSDAPITPGGGDAQWKTTATVPKDGTGFYLLLPLESQQSKYFIDHVVDITTK